MPCLGTLYATTGRGIDYRSASAVSTGTVTQRRVTDREAAHASSMVGCMPGGIECGARRVRHGHAVPATAPLQTRYDPPMYAVILAGGGGTRLWPLSRPETPKPFLPLLGERSLLQRTVARLAGTWAAGRASRHHGRHGRRYWRLVRDQLPGIRVIEEPAGRNTAAAIALAALPSTGPTTRSWSSCRPTSRITDEAIFRGVLVGRRRASPTGAFGIDDPLVTLGHPGRSPGDRVRLPDPGPRCRRQPIHGLQAYPLRAFEEKPSRERAVALRDEPGRRLERGHVPVAAAARSATRSSATRA